jgi:hypothetical protein
MKRNRLTLVLLLALTLNLVTAHADFTGKADFGMVHIESDVINCGTRVKHLNMVGWAGNAIISLYKAFVVRPNFVVAREHSDRHEWDDPRYWSVGLGFGVYVPVSDCVSAVAGFGGSLSEVSYRNNINALLVNKQHEQSSDSANVGLDIGWKLRERTTVSLGLQYAWVRTKTVVELGSMPTSICHTNSSGLNWMAQVDQYLTPCLSINAAVLQVNSKDNDSSGSESLALRGGVGVKF